MQTSETKDHKTTIGVGARTISGFIHSVQYGKPSLVCDFIEVYHSGR